MSKIGTLVIGQGFGPARFGMTEDEITDLFGTPDERETETFEGEDNPTLTLYYDTMQTDFTFDLDEDEDGKDIYKLSSILCTNPAYTLDNKIKFGDTAEQLLKYTNSLKASDPEIQKDPDTGELIYDFDDLNLLAIIGDEGINAIEIGYWDDEDTEE